MLSGGAKRPGGLASAPLCQVQDSFGGCEVLLPARNFMCGRCSPHNSARLAPFTQFSLIQGLTAHEC